VSYAETLLLECGRPNHRQAQPIPTCRLP